MIRHSKLDKSDQRAISRHITVQAPTVLVNCFIQNSYSEWS